MDAEPPGQCGMHFHGIEEGPPANFEMREIAACLPLAEGADAGSGRLIREEDFKTLVRPHKDGVLLQDGIRFLHETRI